MKKQYKTSEICQLFDISLDTIRYYERLGMLHNKRGVNRLRGFTLSDIYRFVKIRDLRFLHIPTPSMKRFLQPNNIASSIQLLQEEKKLLEEHLHEIERTRDHIQQEIQQLSLLRSIRFNQPIVSEFSDRKCLILQDLRTQETLSKKVDPYEKPQNEVLRSLNQYELGTLFNTHDLTTLQPTHHLVCDDSFTSYDYLLPAGSYVTTYYRGGVTQLQQALKLLFIHCIENKYQIDHLIISFSLTHELQTQLEEEQVAQLQIKLK